MKFNWLFDDEGRHIGQEASYRRWDNGRYEFVWFLRVYQDGTALWRPGVLSYSRYSPRHEIDEVIRKYFRTTREELAEDYFMVHTLQRRSCTGVTAQHGQDFGDFLVSKFNNQEEARHAV